MIMKQINKKVLIIYLISVFVPALFVSLFRIMPLFLYFSIIFVILITVVSAGILGLNWKNAILGCGLGPVSASFLRIVFEVIQDPTSNNLWPFTIFFSLIIGILSSVVGILIVLLIKKAKRIIKKYNII